MRKLQDYFIFSTYRPEFSEKKNEHLLFLIRQIIPDATEVVGCYKGGTETSHIVPVERVTKALLSFIFNDCAQESALYIDHERSCFLVENECDINIAHKLPIGKMTEVSMAEALAHENWTYNPNNKKVFTIK